MSSALPLCLYTESTGRLAVLLCVCPALRVMRTNTVTYFLIDCHVQWPQKSRVQCSISLVALTQQWLPLSIALYHSCSCFRSSWYKVAQWVQEDRKHTVPVTVHCIAPCENCCTSTRCNICTLRAKLGVLSQSKADNLQHEWCTDRTLRSTVSTCEQFVGNQMKNINNGKWNLFNFLIWKPLILKTIVLLVLVIVVVAAVVAVVLLLFLLILQ